MLIGGKIKELRKNRKMSLTELAEKTGIQIATLSRIEHMKMTGTLQSHIQIAKALGIELTDLYRDLSTSSPSGSTTHETSHEAESFTYNDKASYEILTNKILARKMMPVLLKLNPADQPTPNKTPPDQNGSFSFFKERST